ncbi:NUDIX hydrolase [Acutalibacter sp. 1XD8-36]|uniref:NUDIX hydrolase n=1 Tax=Acutalibacter sp. 1XD8-36 TaxID=2320852 RepID=UPI001411C4BC|nr:NUDIX domain-containing protein [Acutalibacter sp. 1XD8-36]NBJ90380.1 NUDIX domain-containing protein [Acutalibacter sp. 1XD8-36]
MPRGSICAKIVDWDESISNKYVVIFSRYQGKLLLSRHKGRDTWETQGGHIEQGESPEDAAKRELWEESGALKFTLEPMCMYWAEDRVGGKTESGAWGAIFFADIEELGPMPESEMAETRQFDTLPEEVTYPYITPHLYERVRDRF